MKLIEECFQEKWADLTEGTNFAYNGDRYIMARVGYAFAVMDIVDRYQELGSLDKPSIAEELEVFRAGTEQMLNSFMAKDDH